MNAPFRPALGVFLLGLATPTVVVAQQDLPKAMAGTWHTTNAEAASGRYNPYGGTWSVVIDKQNPDGSIAGKMTWVGGRTCEASDDPITGRYDGIQLTIRGTLRDKFPNAGCGRVRFVLKKTGSGFEGEIPGSAPRFIVTLKAS